MTDKRQTDDIDGAISTVASAGSVRERVRDVFRDAWDAHHHEWEETGEPDPALIEELTHHIDERDLVGTIDEGLHLREIARRRLLMATNFTLLQPDWRERRRAWLAAKWEAEDKKQAA